MIYMKTTEYCKIGEIIKSCRNKKKLSQAQLAKGICSREYINKLEKSLASPTLHLINQLSERLQMNLYSEYLLAYPHVNIETHHRIEKINECIHNADYESLSLVIEECSRYEEFQGGEPFQCLSYARGLVEVHCNRNLEKSLEYYLQGLKCKYTSLENVFKTDLQYSNIDYSLLNSVGVSMLRLKKYEEAIRFYKSFVERILMMFSTNSRYTLNMNFHFYINILGAITYNYFLSLSDFDKNLLLEEEVLLDKVLDIMKDYHFLNTLPELLLYKSKIAFMSNNSKWKEFFKEGHYIGTFVYSEEQITRCEKMIMEEAYELIGSIG